MDSIKCKCGQIFSEQNFSGHFSHCSSFKNEFRKFDNDLGTLLKEYSTDPTNLLIIRILFKQYINVIERKIQALINEGKIPVNQNPSNHFQGNNSGFKKNQVFEPPINKPDPNENYFGKNPALDEQSYQIPQNNNFFNPSDQKRNEFLQAPKNQPDPDIITCQNCQTIDITYLECNHAICIECFKKYAKEDLAGMKCKICQQSISTYYKKAVLGDEYEIIEKELNDKFMKTHFGEFVECPGCHNQFPFEKGTSIDYNLRDEKNQKISREACEHYAQYRVKCINCHKEFCAACKISPYHIGYTCEQFKKRQKALKCRFCGVEIKPQNKGPDDDVCNNEECIERFRLCCKKRLPCGHKCFGTTNDKCPPCLNPECNSFKNVFDQDMDAYCGICYSEGLGAAPIVVLSCNHYVHFHCIKKRLESKWVGPKITFNHMLCPSCNNPYDCSNSVIHALVAQNKALYDEICEKSLKRLKFEDLDKDPKLTNPNSRWYGKNLEFALHRLCYYMCYKCKQPYFAGRRECGDGPNVNNNDPNKNYDPKDCICGKCSNVAGVAGVADCKLHGKEFIEYKCRFCCKIASWFCWGTTHFCEDCHVRQCKGDYISKYPKDKLPKCNPATCELRVRHPPNGEEFALGCSICRNNEENANKNY